MRQNGMSSNEGFVSCFDKEGEEDRGTFWKKVLDEEEIQKIEEMPVLYSGMLFRSRTEIERQYYFELKPGLLLYRAESKGSTIVGVTKLSFQRLDTFQTVDKLYGFRIFTNTSQTRLTSTVRDEILGWYRKLSPMLVNRDFFSRYELKEILGEGAFSQVYKVVEKKTNLVYAAKVVKHKMIASDRRGVLLMKQEIDIMRQLDHPNIVKLIEVQEVHNAVILVMEHVEGCELKKMMMTLSFNDVGNIVRAMTSACAYLESVNIVHRDLKPSNIMIIGTEGKISKNNVKIIDFGLATFVCDKLLLTKCGTPGYIAPEILNAHSRERLTVRHNLDVYSIGIIFYEMVFKMNPFKEGLKNESRKVVRKNAANCVDMDKISIYKNEFDDKWNELMRVMIFKGEFDRPTPTKLLQYEAIQTGRTPRSDYTAAAIEEGKIACHMAEQKYTFKVNPTRFTLIKKPRMDAYRPRELDTIVSDGRLAIISYENLRDNSPESLAVLSPINNRREQYRRRDTTENKSDVSIEHKITTRPEGEINSPLDQRFKGRLRDQSPFLKTYEKAHDPTRSTEFTSNFGQLVSNKSVSVDKLPHSNNPTRKSNNYSTKKQTLMDSESSYRGMLVLHQCNNADHV